MPLPKKFAQQGKAKEKRILANRYIIDKRLGSGNFGTAWLATDRKTKEEKEKLKVIKEMAVGDLQPDETVDAMHEAKLLRNLDHPGIVKFYDSFVEGCFFCIVTEFCEGGDLDQKILEYKKKKKLFPEYQVVEWSIQLLLAVQYMHDRRVLHRDLKTRNIFLRNDKIKIGDFGISRILMGTTDLASTFVGTPYYMSPEVLKHEGYNSKSDVWSVGCIIYEMVSLQHAFEGDSLMGVMYKIVEGNLPEWPSNYSKDLGHVCTSILTKDPAKRPSASESLKIPFIARQMELIKNTMMAQHHAKEHKDSINREAQLLANTMKHNPRLEEIKTDSDKKKWKNMTPRERMRLRKQEQADKDAQLLKEAGQKQRLETHKQFQQIKESQNPYETSKAPIWSGRPDRRKPPEPVDPGAYSSHHGASVFHEEDEEDSSSEEDESDERDAHTYDERLGRPSADKGRPYNTVSADDRPITPLRDKMIYDLRNSSLDFKDGIPERPDIAETYYSQFADFEENLSSSSDDDSDDDDDVVYSTAKQPRRGSVSDEDAEGTLVAAAIGDKEEEDLINYMQNALDMSDTAKSSTLVADDSAAGAFGPAIRNVKIKNLRAEAIKNVGEKNFHLAYDFLKKARFGDDKTKAGKSMEEKDIFAGLEKLVGNTRDYFLIDQLLFLEKQAEISVET